MKTLYKNLYDSVSLMAYNTSSKNKLLYSAIIVLTVMMVLKQIYLFMIHSKESIKNSKIIAIWIFSCINFSTAIYFYTHFDHLHLNGIISLKFFTFISLADVALVHIFICLYQIQIRESNRIKHPKLVFIGIPVAYTALTILEWIFIAMSVHSELFNNLSATGIYSIEYMNHKQKELNFDYFCVFASLYIYLLSSKLSENLKYFTKITINIMMLIGIIVCPFLLFFVFTIIYIMFSI